MKIIKELCEKDLGINISKPNVKYTLRRAARAVLLDKDNNIALLYVEKDKYHKLPGGGIEEGENIQIALKREIIEEVGAEIAVIEEIGCILEFRDEHELMQISYCYLSKINGELSKPQFTEEELESGFKLIWYSIEKAIEKLKEDRPLSYMGSFIKMRDLAFIESASQIVHSHSGYKKKPKKK